MQYSPWAGPIFLVCTILVFLLGFLALYSFRRRRDRFRTAAGGQAVVALITNLLDISHVGGPPPPFEPLVLGLVSIGFALLALALLPWAFRG